MGAEIDKTYLSCRAKNRSFITKLIGSIKKFLSADALIDKSVIDTAIKEVFEGKYQKGEISKPLFKQTYGRLSGAVDKGFAKIRYGDPDYEFVQALKHNTAVFSAFKNHHQTAELVGALVDSKGKVRSFSDFKKNALGISKKYNQRWLQTEYNMALHSSRTASKWKQFERTKHIYPNLEYMPSRSVKQRDSHKEYYGTVLSIEHSFWDTSLPPNGWGCNCWVRRSKKEASTEDITPIKPTPGIVGNAGKTGQLFDAKHNFVKNTTTVAKKSIKEQLEKLERGSIRSDCLKKAKELQGKKVKHSFLEKSIVFTRKGIKEFINQPHKYYNEKNLLAYDLKEVVKTATYVRSAPNLKGNRRIVQFHYFETKVKKETSFIIIKETIGGEQQFYGVVEKIKGN